MDPQNPCAGPTPKVTLKTEHRGVEYTIQIATLEKLVQDGHLKPYEIQAIPCQPTHAFHSILREMGELHDRKQADYGKTGDPFANVRASEDFGIAGWQGCIMRANDKMRRLQAFCVNGSLKNESVEDSLLDLAVYAVIALILFREKQSSLQPLASSKLGETFLKANVEAGQSSSREETVTCPLCGVQLAQNFKVHTCSTGITVKPLETEVERLKKTIVEYAEVQSSLVSQVQEANQAHRQQRELAASEAARANKLAKINYELVQEVKRQRFVAGPQLAAWLEDQQRDQKSKQFRQQQYQEGKALRESSPRMTSQAFDQGWEAAFEFLTELCKPTVDTGTDSPVTSYNSAAQPG